MEKKEMKEAIKSVYGQLWDLLSLYVETDRYNKVPAGEPEEDIWDYMGKKIAEIRKNVSVLFIGEEKLSKKLKWIIDETEYFVRRYEMPGVVERWKQINPNLTYFDCVFDMMEELPVFYMFENCLMRGGVRLPVCFNCYPGAELAARRKAYFKEMEEKSKRANLQYSEEIIFQNELLHTLELLFEMVFREFAAE